MPDRPIKILHLLYCLGHGGVEVWLMNMLRAIDRAVFKFDFVVHTQDSFAFDAEAEQLGSKIIRISPPQESPLTYGRTIRRLLRQHGTYDIVHSHVHFFSGYILRQAAHERVPMRIAHSHNDSRILDQNAGMTRKIYLRMMDRWIQQNATVGLACSTFAAEALFGKQWREDRRWQVLLYGIDFSRFGQLPSRALLREQLQLPNNRRIIGQVGRLVEQKNHAFTVRVFQELIRSGIDGHLLLVGGGTLEQDIRRQISDAGLTDRVTLAGDQHDVAPFIGAMDCALFPSHNEGLGIVALEAQAAGVPTIASDRVPPEAAVIPGMVEYLPLSAGPARWTEALRHRLAEPPGSPVETAAQMARCDFSVHTSVERLSSIYRGNHSPGQKLITPELQNEPQPA